MNINLLQPIKKLNNERKVHREHQMFNNSLSDLLMDGAMSPVIGEANTQYFSDLREKISKRLQA